MVILGLLRPLIAFAIVERRMLERSFLQSLTCEILVFILLSIKINFCSPPLVPSKVAVEIHSQ